MNIEKISGILFIILGLIFIIFPMFSAELVSVIVGVSLLFFGFASIINGFSVWNMLTHFSLVNIIIGIIAIIFGLLFIFAIDALSFLVGLQFYIIGFIMIFFGIVGLIAESRLSKTTSVLILIFGIIAVALAVYSIAEPIYAAILIGACLIIQGLRLFID
ncbi:MAG: DUF308 domain-containing protein [Methanobrevibacter sp.]|uniref:DUF308 domain-containing protein n=1 Tax=Methanobrevibacter sp. TaxID=66852 RepID=UPI0025FDEC4B|nr:DUF308 domain-containing protein [Methanobrevibacter sp.]MBR0271505.1 DUF308 domain-containing protein [Methanobrevibacter sp.]